MIYQENIRDKEPPLPSPEDPLLNLFSSFRKKSILLESDESGGLNMSVERFPHSPSKLRDLIQESGILDELERDEDLRSFLDDDFKEGTEKDCAHGTSPSIVVGSTLRNVMEDVLTIDDQETIRRSCSSGPCTYHSDMTDAFVSQQETFSDSSRPAKARSFVETLNECTPQFDAQYLTRAKLATKLHKSSPPRFEETQPSRSSLQLRPLSRPPSTVEAGGKHRHSTNKLDGKISRHLDDSHFHHPIPRNDSGQTCQTLISEVTWHYDMVSPSRLMRLDPRAPQYQIAHHQEKHEEEVTMRTKNHSVLKRRGPVPPVRRPTSECGSPDPPIRKQSSESHEQAPSAVTPDSEECPGKHSSTPPLVYPIGRKGTIGGVAADQLNSMQGNVPVALSAKVNASPQHNAPFEDRSPLSHLATLISPSDDHSDEKSLSTKSTKPPFVRLSTEKRRNRHKPVTPDHDSYHLRYPYSIGYYPPSPSRLPMPPNRAPSPVAQPPRVSLSAPFKALLLPLETSSSEDLSRYSSQSSALTLGETTIGDETFQEENEKDSTIVATTLSIRAKLIPRKITFSFEGQERVMSGLYSGSVDRYDRIHGNGVFWFNTGDVYLGQFSEGHLHGAGAMAIKADDGSKKVLRGFFQKNEYVGVNKFIDGMEDESQE